MDDTNISRPRVPSLWFRKEHVEKLKVLVIWLEDGQYRSLKLVSKCKRYLTIELRALAQQCNHSWDINGPANAENDTFKLIKDGL